MIGLIARADQGGLGAQTWEMARHVRPSKILIVDLGPNGRGATRADRYENLGAEVFTCLGTPRGKHLEWLLDGVHAVYTAEGPYNDLLPSLAAERGVRLVLHANPELWAERYRGPTTDVALPTAWEQHRVHTSTVMPMPVARDRLPWGHREQARTFWHPAAPAMLDRNGTDIVLNALGHVRWAVTVIVSGSGRPEGITQIGRTTVVWAGERGDYWEGYDDADVLLLPRRYGGLSLPAQEALSAGLPVVMLDTGPYVGLGGVLAVPALSAVDMAMKGGSFPVHDTDPRLLAEKIDQLVDNPQLVALASLAANGTADALSWDAWRRPWRTLLERP